MTKTADTDNPLADQETVELDLPTAVEPVKADPPASAVATDGIGLGTKFFFAATLLVIVTLGTSLAVATWRSNVVAERTIREGLGRVPLVYRAYEADLKERLIAQVASLAEESRAKSLFAPDVNIATRWDFAQEQAKILGARTLFLFDRESAVLARSDKPEGKGVGKLFGRVAWVADPLWKRRNAAAAIVDKNALALVASVSVLSGEGSETRVEGVLAASFPLTEDEVEILHGITRGEVAFLTNTAPRGEPPTAELTAATESFDGESFLAALTANGDSLAALLDRGETIGPLDLVVGGQSRLTMGVPIKSSSGEPRGAFIVTRSRAEETAAFREIRNVLLAIGGAMLLLALPISFAMGRRIAQPLEQLTRGTLAIREGQLDVRLPEERSDEVGALARAFRGMVTELKEKRALQDLLEEMRRRPQESRPESDTQAPTGGELESGQILGGRYEVMNLLGKGGMGQVFRAKDIELDDIVAVKVLTPKAFKKGDAVETLKREIRIARRITHSNVVRVHDFADADGIRFVTMEYVPGTTLRALVARQKNIEMGPSLQIVKQLCRGLGAIHKAGILHRDMKPENVMVLPNGMVKLMDFGIAEVLQPDGDHKKAEFVVGTPRYMSPEQLRGEHLDPRSDIYAVGAIMYEMFTGIQPFGGKTLADVVQKHMNYVPERPTFHRSEVPEWLSELVLQCLAKTPDQRPNNVGTLYTQILKAES